MKLSTTKIFLNLQGELDKGGTGQRRIRYIFIFCNFYQKTFKSTNLNLPKYCYYSYRLILLTKPHQLSYENSIFTQY